MTEKEAIKQLKFDREMILINPSTGETYKPVELKIINKDNYKTYIADGMAIAALEEIQKYREIGTVDECQVAVDRATAKPLTNLNACPNCGRYIGNDVRPWCHSCGQRLDWEAKR